MTMARRSAARRFRRPMIRSALRQRVVRLLIAVGLLAAFMGVPQGDAAAALWIPGGTVDWQVQATGALTTTARYDMLIVPLYWRDRADLAPIVETGTRVVCTLHAGIWSADWPDADRFTPGMLGKRVWGEPAQRWIDIRQTGVRSLIAERLDHARAIGCSGIDAYRVDSWFENTGIRIGKGDQLAFNRWLANEAHARGLSIGLRGAVDLIPDLIDWYDFATVEGCLERADCQLVLPFVGAGKPVFHWEFTTAVDGGVDVCRAAKTFRFSTIVKHRQLDAWRYACYAPDPPRKPA
jgi:hypothetical protein